MESRTEPDSHRSRDRMLALLRDASMAPGQSLDEKYEHDAVHRLKSLEREDLSAGSISNKQFAECWPGRDR